MLQAGDAVPGSMRPARAPGTQDRAATGGLGAAVGAILPALEAFNRFDAPERTALQRAVWTERLDGPLPREGEGADAVLSLLRERTPYAALTPIQREPVKFADESSYTARDWGNSRRSGDWGPVAGRKGVLMTPSVPGVRGTTAESVAGVTSGRLRVCQTR